jgi:hypothetical protein
MKRKLEDSEALYERIKSFYKVEANSSLVIEISDSLPIESWRTRVAYSEEEMKEDRVWGNKNKEGFAAFSSFNSEYDFGFFDYNFCKIVNLENNQVEYFNSAEADLHELKLAAGDLKGLLEYASKVVS